MWYAAQVAETIHKYGPDYGFDSRLDSFDWQKLVRNRQAYIERIHHSYQNSLSNNQVDLIHGTATFIDSHTIEVNDEQLTADHILIAGDWFLGGWRFRIHTEVNPMKRYTLFLQFIAFVH